MRDEKAFRRDLADWKRNVPFYRHEAGSPFQAKFEAVKRSVYALGDAHRRVLDIGAGLGGFASRLQREGRTVVAVDFVEDMALAARGKNAGLPYVVASADRLPFKAGCCDAIVADGVLHHLKVQGILEEGLSEAVRVLRRGGRLCSFDRNGSLLSSALFALFVAFNKALRVWKPEYASSATGQECSLGSRDRAMIARAGFTTVTRRNVSSFPFFLAIVFTNAVEYLAGARAAARWRLRVFPPAAWLEDRIRARALTVEECAVYDLRPAGDPATAAPPS